MNISKLLGVLDEGELYEIAETAEAYVNKYSFAMGEKERQADFISALELGLRNYFFEEVNFEPLALHYIDKHWQENHSYKARELEEADRRNVND